MPLPLWFRATGKHKAKVFPEGRLKLRIEK